MQTAFARKFLVLGTKIQTWRRPGVHGIQLPKVDNFVWRCNRTILMILMTADNIQDQFCFKDTPPKRDTVESNEQSIDSNVENAASRRLANIRIHPNTSQLRVCCSRPPSCFHSPLLPRQKFLHINQTKSCFAFKDLPSARIFLPPCKQPLNLP